MITFHHSFYMVLTVLVHLLRKPHCIRKYLHVIVQLTMNTAISKNIVFRNMCEFSSGVYIPNLELFQTLNRVQKFLFCLFKTVLSF
jgi:hypothetical protein